MRGIALCWIALATAGCAFEGAEGGPLDQGPGTVPDLPVGDSRVTGSISSSELLGTFGAALLPAATLLPAANPCFPKGTRTELVKSLTNRTFAFEAVAPGEYLLVAFRAAGAPDELERTMKLITVTGTDTDVGSIALPRSIHADLEESDGGGRGGGETMVKWTAPIGVAPFTAFAYNIGGRSSNACTAGALVNVLGTYEVRLDRDKLRIGLEAPAAGQMAIKVVEPESDRR
jgi:hypothetical protein